MAKRPRQGLPQEALRHLQLILGTIQAVKDKHGPEKAQYLRDQLLRYLKGEIPLTDIPQYDSDGNLAN